MNCVRILSLAKMLAGANAFEISDIQEDESEATLARRSDVTMLHWVENGWMEFFAKHNHFRLPCEGEEPFGLLITPL